MKTYKINEELEQKAKYVWTYDYGLPEEWFTLNKFLEYELKGVNIND